MIQPEDNLSPIAPVNRPFAVGPAGPLRRAERWLSRLMSQVRRRYLCRLRPRYVAESQSRRQGECRQCGACCDLTVRCPFLASDSLCRAYGRRPLVCRVFPIDARDLALTRVPCGHYFARRREEADVRIPLTKYGAKEIALFGGLAVAAIVLSVLWFWYIAPLFALGLGFVLFFFRDPERRIPQEPGVLVAPADGKVVEISEVEPTDLELEKGDADLLPEACCAQKVPVPFSGFKISIFMSPLDVHVNRSPCAGTVEAVRHRPGRFRHAEDPKASAENESNMIAIGGVDGRTQVVVRQVAGVMARRIVCDAAVGDRLERGQRLGMVKFGSRAEVYVPADSGFRPTVRLGQHVKAGETVIARSAQGAPPAEFDETHVRQGRDSPGRTRRGVGRGVV